MQFPGLSDIMTSTTLLSSPSPIPYGIYFVSAGVMLILDKPEYDRCLPSRLAVAISKNYP